jgi:hypothetical protein
MEYNSSVITLFCRASHTQGTGPGVAALTNIRSRACFAVMRASPADTNASMVSAGLANCIAAKQTKASCLSGQPPGDGSRHPFFQIRPVPAIFFQTVTRIAF